MAFDADSPIFHRLLVDAAIAFRLDSRYAEQILLAAKTAQLKRNTWAARADKKIAMDAVMAEVLAEELDLRETG